MYRFQISNTYDAYELWLYDSWLIVLCLGICLASASSKDPPDIKNIKRLRWMMNHGFCLPSFLLCWALEEFVVDKFSFLFLKEFAFPTQILILNLLTLMGFEPTTILITACPLIVLLTLSWLLCYITGAVTCTYWERECHWKCSHFTMFQWLCSVINFKRVIC